MSWRSSEGIEFRVLNRLARTGGSSPALLMRLILIAAVQERKVGAMRDERGDHDGRSERQLVILSSNERSMSDMAPWVLSFRRDMMLPTT